MFYCSKHFRVICFVILAQACRHQDDQAVETPQPSAPPTEEVSPGPGSPSPSPTPSVIPPTNPPTPSQRPYPPIVEQPVPYIPSRPIETPEVTFSGDSDVIKFLETASWKNTRYGSAIAAYRSESAIYGRLKSRLAKLNFLQYLLSRESTCNQKYISRGGNTPAFVCAHFSAKLYFTYRDDQTLTQDFCVNSESESYCIKQVEKKLRLPIRDVSVQFSAALDDASVKQKALSLHAINAVKISADANESRSENWIFIEPQNGLILFETNENYKAFEPVFVSSKNNYKSGTILLVGPHHAIKIDRQMSNTEEFNDLLDFLLQKEAEAAYRIFRVEMNGSLARNEARFAQNILSALQDKSLVGEPAEKFSSRLPFALVTESTTVGDLQDALLRSDLAIANKLSKGLEELSKTSPFKDRAYHNSKDYYLRLLLAQIVMNDVSSEKATWVHKAYKFDNYFLDNFDRMRNGRMRADNNSLSWLNWSRLSKREFRQYFEGKEFANFQAAPDLKKRQLWLAMQLERYYMLNGSANYPRKDDTVGIYKKSHEHRGMTLQDARSSCKEGSRLPTFDELSSVANELSEEAQRGSCLWTSTPLSSNQDGFDQSIWSFTEEAKGVAAKAASGSAVCEALCVVPVVFE